MAPLWKELRDGDRANSDEYRVAQILWDKIYGMSLGGGGSGRIELPSDYQYRDAAPGDVVAGRTPFGKTVRMSDKRDENDGREKLAEWIVGRTEATVSLGHRQPDVETGDGEGSLRTGG